MSATGRIRRGEPVGPTRILRVVVRFGRRDASLAHRQDACATMSLMRTIVVTGSAGLIGSETVKRFAGEGARVIGIDNDMREKFFGAEAST